MMTNVKKMIMGATVGLYLGLSIVPAQAFLVYDAPRTAQLAGQGIQRLMSLLIEYQKVHAKEEELKIWEQKKKMREKGEDGSENGDLPASECYNYATQAVNQSTNESTKYLPVEKATDTKAAEKMIREKFFVRGICKGEKPATQQEREQAILNRHKYLEEVSKEVLSLSEGIREKTAQDLKHLSEVPNQAGGQIQQIYLMTHTKRLMTQQKATDLLFQTKLLELEAAEMMTNLPVELPCEEEGGTK